MTFSSNFLSKTKINFFRKGKSCQQIILALRAAPKVRTVKKAYKLNILGP